MAYVFVSHSKNDTKYLDFLNRAFATSALNAKYEEIEAIDGGPRNGEQIAADIRSSLAVFVLLSENVENLKHTRDWVAWESGVGHDKEVWVFEPVEAASSISVVVPRVDHLVAFRTSDIWLSHIRQCINYIKRQRAAHRAAFWIEMLTPSPAMITRLIIEDFLMEGRLKHAKLIVDSFQCTCNAQYTLHREQGCAFRCPVCNRRTS